MKLRRKILADVWEKEEEKVHFQKFLKGSVLYNKHQLLLAAIKSDFWDKAKAAVQEKYLTMCKNSYLDDVM